MTINAAGRSRTQSGNTTTHAHSHESIDHCRCCLSSGHTIASVAVMGRVHRAI